MIPHHQGVEVGIRGMLHQTPPIAVKEVKTDQKTDKKGSKFGKIGFFSGHLPTTTTPQGRSPTFNFLTTAFVARSTIDTSFDGPFAVNSSFSSGDSAIPQGRCPTSNAVSTFPAAVSTIATVLPRP